MSTNRSIAGRAGALLLFFAAAAAPLLRGGVSPRAQVLACACAALALGLAAVRDRRGRTPRLPLLVLAPLLVFAVAALQCLPLPAQLLSLLAPVNASLRFFPPAPARQFAPLTLDLTATAASLTPIFAVACALAAAALLARRPRTQLLLLAAPLGAALLQLAICFVRLAGQGRLAGTFVNRNHLAGLLALGCLTAVGAALAPPREEEPGTLPPLATARPLWIAGAAACAAGVLLTLSRGAAVSLAVGALVLLGLDERSHRIAGTDSPVPRSRRRRARLLWILLPLGGGLAAALLLSTSPLTARFGQLAQQPLSADLKLRSFLGAVDVALEHPLAGVGRGAWRFVAERHRSVPGELAFVYVENEPLQLAAEEGLPVALLVLALALLGWLRAAKAARSGLSRGALAGALAVGLQNLVDFNLEFVGVALPLAVAVGAALVDERPTTRREPPPAGSKPQPPVEPRGWRRIPRPLLFGAALLGLGVAPLPLLLAPWSAEREADRLVFEARQPATSADALLADAAATVERHPADWLVSLAPAIGLQQRTPRRTAEALAWAGRAQLLGPKSWRPHYVAAAILLRAGRPAQARVEIRLALENLDDLPFNDPLELAAQSAQTLDELLEATPDDPLQRAQVAVHLRVQRRGPLGRALLEHELALPDAARTTAATTALESELANTLLEARDFAAAEQVAARLPLADCGRALLLSQARRALARTPAEIEQPLVEARPLCPRQLQIYDLLFHGRLARQELAAAAALLDEPVLSDSTLPFAAQVHVWRAELLEARGERSAAMHERWMSALLAPDEGWRALDYAERLRQQGDLPGALAALRTLSLRASGDGRATIDARITQLEALRAQQRVPPGVLRGR